jgi:TatD DNase family protein
MIDSHAHLDMKQFDKDRSDVINRAKDAGVKTIISVGIDLESSQKAIELADEHPAVFATVGFHPHEVAKMKETDIVSLTEMTSHSKVVAIGEIGLDFHRDGAPREKQLQALKWQLEMAKRLNLSVIIHCREAEELILPLLDDWASSFDNLNEQTRGIIHCFSGDIGTAQRYLNMGFFVSFGAYIGYPSSRNLRNVIRSIPLDKMVIETDCPFLPPQMHRGKRNEPSYLSFTVRALADIKEVSPEMITSETTRNIVRLFRWPLSE